MKTTLLFCGFDEITLIGFDQERVQKYITAYQKNSNIDDEHFYYEVIE